MGIRIFSAACLCAALAGCASIPPDKDVLPRQDLARAELAPDIKLAREGWPAAQWWTEYQDAQLNGLIGQALSAGPTLQVAAARIGSAGAALAFERADRGADVNLDAQANRQRYSSNGLFPAPIGGSYYSEETVQLQARYDLDWWGKHKAQIGAALGEVQARRADYAQAEQSLAAEVAHSYFRLQGGWARLDKLRQMTRLQDELVADRIKRVGHGLAAIDEQRIAEGQLSQLNEQGALLEAQVGREREALRALLGADSGALAELKPHAAPALPTALPARLGLELLARRPDLQAAHWRVEASLSQIEVAQAAFYPDINLTGTIGLDAVALGKLFASASRTLFLGPTLSLPLFDSKRLDARLGSARNARNEMIADYNQTVFDVVREVAQAGVDLQGTEKQIVQQAGALRAASAQLQGAQAKFRQGLLGRGPVLDAEIGVLKLQDASLQLQNRQLNAQVTLVKALGGGYRSPLLAQSSK